MRFQPKQAIQGMQLESVKNACDRFDIMVYYPYNKECAREKGANLNINAMHHIDGRYCMWYGVFIDPSAPEK